jgi:hypothetical protein
MSSASGIRGIALAVFISISGCAGKPGQVDYDLVFTDVEPIEYARILCARIPLGERHSCMTAVIDHHREYRYDDRPPENVVGGPFVMFIGNEMYRGSYVSQPFAAAFSVTSGSTICRGRYNAFAGDTRAIFDVWCDDGGRGSANIILDRGGRNGIGQVIMDDGRTGRIVFGAAAVGGELYWGSY